MVWRCWRHRDGDSDGDSDGDGDGDSDVDGENDGRLPDDGCSRAGFARNALERGNGSVKMRDSFCARMPALANVRGQ